MPATGFLLERRLDHVEVIGHALVLGIVIGLGTRKVANQVGVPMTTARGWRRRFRVRAAALTAVVVAVAVHWIRLPCSWTATTSKPLPCKWLVLPGSAPADVSVTPSHAYGGSGA
jgi:hypothetical protein